MTKFYQHVVRGKKWHYCRAPVSEFLGVDVKTKVWHLWEGYGLGTFDYIGNFNTKRELLEFIGVEAN